MEIKYWYSVGENMTDIKPEDWKEIKEWLSEWKRHLEKGDRMFLGHEETISCLTETLKEMEQIEKRREKVEI